MGDRNKSETSVEIYSGDDTSERENQSGDATEDQTSDLAANISQQTTTNPIDSPIDSKDEHIHLLKGWNGKTHVDDSVNQSHVKVFININDKSESNIFMEIENQQEKTRESNNATSNGTQSNDNEVCQKTETYKKYQMDDNVKTDKSPDELNFIYPTTESSILEDCPIMQRAPSHITIAKWTKTNTHSLKVKQLDLETISEEVDIISRHNSQTSLVCDLDVDDIAENGIRIGNSTFYINIESTSESIHKMDKTDNLFGKMNDDEIESKGDRLSWGVSDDDTDSKDLQTSLQSLKHDESEAVGSCMDCIKPVQVKTWKEINQGDHIILSRSFYDHHAIVIRIIPPEDDNSQQISLELIHQTNSAMGAVRDSILRAGTLAKLKRKTEIVNLKTDIVMICKYWGSIKPRSPREVVKRAIGALRGAKEEFRYDVFDNNCEHFASWCVTGRRLSIQIRKYKVVRKIFVKLHKGFRGLSDELLRNQIEYEHGMLCKMCFERNEKMLGVTRRKVLQKDDIQKGDIILRRYWQLQHCSVVLNVMKRKEKYIKCEIAHYAFKGPFTQKKIQSDILKVPFNGSVSVFDYSSGEFQTYGPEEVVCRARKRIGEQMFSYFSNDSSHFARWCKLKLLN
ncbi:unnamed protein product [Mytilus coruscus]|uniref:LRAT domain-containing protein n=1 Tax=Mytilus coruscus TaxID=42192 RepID=A0A6J8A3K3_MYTCO|nr:unnamed protein product [Mytilus coruscus]